MRRLFVKKLGTTRQCKGMERNDPRLDLPEEGRRGSEEAVPGPSVFPSREPGVSGDFWAME